MQKSRRIENFEGSKNRTVTGQWNDHCPVPRAAKTHQEYWKTRIKRRPFRDGRGATVVPPEYSVRMFHLGREVWFNLDTASQSAAAVKARDIYLSLVGAGWIATLEKCKPSPMARADVCVIARTAWWLAPQLSAYVIFCFFRFFGVLTNHRTTSESRQTYFFDFSATGSITTPRGR